MASNLLGIDSLIEATDAGSKLLQSRFALFVLIEGCFTQSLEHPEPCTSKVYVAQYQKQLAEMSFCTRVYDTYQNSNSRL